jgi:hypothetical protein
MGLNDDIVSWRFRLKGLFFVKSVYNALTVNESGQYHKKNLERENSRKTEKFSLDGFKQCYFNKG